VSHLGSRVSALLDGRLPAAEEERLWEHVHACHPCRDLVEREGWVKTQLASLSFEPGGAPARLKDSLLCPGPALRPTSFPTDFATASRPRHRGLALIGGGAAGAAVVGVLALGAAGTPQLERRAPVSDLNRPVTSVSVDPQARPVRRTRTPAPSQVRSSQSSGEPSGQTSGQTLTVRHLLDEVAARGTMGP
jgi:anti-sigma factor RsiW